MLIYIHVFKKSISPTCLVSCCLILLFYFLISSDDCNETVTAEKLRIACWCKDQCNVTVDDEFKSANCDGLGCINVTFFCILALPLGKYQRKKIKNSSSKGYSFPFTDFAIT